MSKIYISSTYNDLKEYREVVYHTLRQMRHDVFAMEDYVAQDQRPLQKCLQDVASSDIYVGIFAWRYGYIPNDNRENPNNLSITELEYRKAKEKGIPCLVFLLDDSIPWPLKFSDGTPQSNTTGDNIIRLRNELQNNHTRGSFTNPDNLASSIVTAVNAIDKASTSDSITDSSEVFKIKTLDQLESYYNVDPQRIIKIRDLNLYEIKNWVKNWNQKQEIVLSCSHQKALSKSVLSSPDKELKKPLLLITGDPGTGKSWLAYRLVSELMEKDHYSISVISGTDIRKQLFAKNNNYTEKDDNKKEISNRSLFILDDIGTSVGIASSNITLDDIYEILKSILPGGLENDFAAPIILTIREENWNYIVNGAESKVKLDENKLKEMVKKVVLVNLEYRESERIVESFYKVVDEKKPPYPNLIITEEVKDRIIEKSKGIPFIVKLFFDQISSKIGNSQRYTVTLEEADEIISNAKYYALKQFFNYYPISNNDKEQVTNVLSFLYFIAKNGSISIGFLGYMKEELKEKIPNYFEEYLSSSRSGKSFPLFNIDNYGIMLPFHTSIIEAIINLIENPEDLEAEVPANNEEIKEKIRDIIDIDIDINIKEKSENKYLTRYIDFLNKSLDYYLERKLNREIERRRNISATSAYNFFSIFIEFLNTRNEFKFGGESENRYITKLKDLLEKTTIDYGNLEINIHEQLFWIFTRTHWFYYGSKPLRQYYLKFLTSTNNNVKVKTWKQIPDLLSSKALTREEIRTMKEHFLVLLNSDDENIREEAWNGWHISELIRNSIVTVDELRSIKNKFFELLQSNQDDVRTTAWQSLSYHYYSSYLITNKIITRSDRDIFLNFLEFPNESIRADTWNAVIYLVKENILKSEEIFQLQDYYYELLRSKYENIKEKAWMNVSRIIENKILKAGDIIPFKDSFFDLLQNTTNNNLYNIWIYHIEDLVKSKILNLEESIFFYDKSLEIEPKNTSAWNDKGNVYYNLKQYDEALKCYNQALEIDPKYTYALNGKGYMLAESGRNNEAFSLIKKELLSNPNDEYLQSTMAFILHNLGKINDSKYYYQKALQINPDLLDSFTENELNVFNKVMNNNDNNAKQ